MNKYIIVAKHPDYRNVTVRRTHAKTAKAAAKVWADKGFTVREVLKVVAHTARTAKLTFSE